MMMMMLIVEELDEKDSGRGIHNNQDYEKEYVLISISFLFLF